MRYLVRARPDPMAKAAPADHQRQLGCWGCASLEVHVPSRFIPGFAGVFCF